MAVEYLPFEQSEKEVKHSFSKGIESCYAFFEKNIIKCEEKELIIMPKSGKLEYDKILVNFKNGERDQIILKDISYNTKRKRIIPRDNLKSVFHSLYYSESNSFLNGRRNYKQKIELSQNIYKFHQRLNFSRSKSDRYYFDYSAGYGQHNLYFGGMNLNNIGDVILGRNIYGFKYGYKSIVLKYGKIGQQYNTENKKAFSISNYIKVNNYNIDTQYQRLQDKDGFSLVYRWKNRSINSSQMVSFIDDSHSYKYKNSLSFYNLLNYKDFSISHLNLNFEYQPSDIENFYGYQTPSFFNKNFILQENFYINRKKQNYLSFSQTFNISKNSTDQTYVSSFNYQRFRYMFSQLNRSSLYIKNTVKKHKINYTYRGLKDHFNSEVSKESDLLYNQDVFSISGDYNSTSADNSNIRYNSKMRYTKVNDNEMISTDIGGSFKYSRNLWRTSIGLSFKKNALQSKRINFGWNYNLEGKAKLSFNTSIIKYIPTNITNKTISLNYNFNYDVDSTKEYEELVYNKKKRIYFIEDKNYNFIKDELDQKIPLSNVHIYNGKGERVDVESHEDYVDFIIDEREQYQVRLYQDGLEIVNGIVRHDDDGIILVQRYRTKIISLLDNKNKEDIVGFSIDVICGYNYTKSFQQGDDRKIKIKYINDDCIYNLNNKLPINYAVKKEIDSFDTIEIERFSQIDINFRGLTSNEIFILENNVYDVNKSFPIISIKNLTFQPEQETKLKKHICELNSTRSLKQFNHEKNYFEKITYNCKKKR